MMNVLMRVAFGFGTVILLAAAPVAVIAEETRQSPNIVLMFADDLGYGDLSCYGNPTVRTPNLDRLASGGLRLTSFYSAPVCVPARVQLILGRYQSRTGVGGTSVGGSGGIAAEDVTLAEAIKAAGYRTAMMGKWHLGYVEDELLPVGQGFDYWFGLPYSNDMRKPWVNTDVPLWLYENIQRIEHPVDQDTLTTRYTERAVEFIKKKDDQPFFLYLAYSMPHLPIHTTERFRGQSRAGLYGDVIETIDWSAGQVIQALREVGQQENTVVIFTSDNGPWLNLPARMLQEGNLPWHAGSPGPLRGSKGSTYEGGVRVPCILWWPGTIDPGRCSADLAATMDLYVTLIQLAGGQLPDYTLDGHDLTPFLLGHRARSPREHFFYFRGRRLMGVRAGAWKLHLDKEVQLFHLDVDPGERYNRAEEKPELVNQLRGRLEEMANETGSNYPWPE